MKVDCIQLTEIPYKSTANYCETPCPHVDSKVASSYCTNSCSHFVSIDEGKQIVECAWRGKELLKDEKSLQLSNINETSAYVNKELLKPKFAKETQMTTEDRKLIEQFEDINFFYINKIGSKEIRVFNKKYNIISNGVVIESGSYIKGIDMFDLINFLELTENETTPKHPNLSVSLKIQPDGKTVVAECTHIADELRGKGVLAEKDWYKIRSDYSIALSKDVLYVRGEYKERDYIIFSYNFDTPEQAQHYVKIMNELIDEINNPKTNWSKVEEGADVKVKVVKVDCGWTFNCKFKEYVKETNQIIVFNDNKVEVYDASEVELC